MRYREEGLGARGEGGGYRKTREKGWRWTVAGVKGGAYTEMVFSNFNYCMSYREMLIKGNADDDDFNCLSSMSTQHFFSLKRNRFTLFLLQKTDD